MPVNIWWIRRDLRIQDNPALQTAMKSAAYSAAHIVPVFVLDPLLLNSQYTGSKRLAFLLGGLAALERDLRKRGSYLVVRRGNPENVLADLLTGTGAAGIYAEGDHSPFARSRDSVIIRRLPLNLVGSPAILNPGSVLKQDGAPYTVFTPFSKAWKGIFQTGDGFDLSDARVSIHTPPGIFSEQLSTLTEDTSPLFPPGESEAMQRLSKFLSDEDTGLFGYAKYRDRVDLDGTSRLSPYLRFGMLSARRAALSAMDALKAARNDEDRRGAETWLNELIWRDFYIHILHHFPLVRRVNFRPLAIAWLEDAHALAAWQQGSTGYPIVDAGMRQLKATGWMHNRARMITASFLTKHLLIHWSEGERWFMQHLIDGDPAANNGGWQWTAGTGTDAAPFFRIFNPILQGIKFDPAGSFIRSWVPELKRVPDEYIHEPWKMPQDIQSRSMCRIGIDYPNPVIDHTFARQRALAAFSSIK